MSREKIKMKYRFEAQQLGDKNVHLMYFYDEISARGKFNWDTWEYEDSETSSKYIRDALDQIPNGEEIEIHINSQGGEVGEGVTIYNLLMQKRQQGSRIVCYVDGYCYSVAVDIAMAAGEIHMGLGTSMLLHFPWAYCQGNAKELRSMADNIEALGDAAVQLYMHRAKNITEEDLRALMDAETVLTPTQCLEYGFCDVVDTYEAKIEEPENDPTQIYEKYLEAKKQLAARSEFMAMLQSLKAQTPAPTPEPVDDMRNTFLKALRGI